MAALVVAGHQPRRAGLVREAYARADPRRAVAGHPSHCARCTWFIGYEFELQLNRRLEAYQGLRRRERGGAVEDAERIPRQRGVTPEPEYWGSRLKEFRQMSICMAEA